MTPRYLIESLSEDGGIMNTNSTNGQNANALTQQKSLLIIQGQFQQAMGQQAEAARLFLEAAVLEERLAEGFKQAGNDEDASISSFSAASCYKNARQNSQALVCATNALSLTNAATFAEEIRQFRDECLSAASSVSQRILRGVVRNGAVYPSEQGVLAEGELVTITTA